MRVKRTFLEKKLKKYQNKIIEFPLNEEKNKEMNIFVFSTMIYNLRGENFKFGDYYFFDDDTHYNSNTLEFYNTLDFFKYVESKLQNRSEQLTNEDYTALINKFPFIENFNSIDLSFYGELYKNNVINYNDNYVAKITKNKDVIYLRDEKYFSDFVHNTSYNVFDIPLDKFTIFISFDRNEIRGVNKEFKEIISGEFTFTEITKYNMDDILFEEFGNEKGYIDDKYKEGYDYIYNQLFNFRERMYLVNYSCFFPSHFLERDFKMEDKVMWLGKNTCNELGITKDEEILYALDKRLSLICNYFKDLDSFSNIDLRVFEEKESSKNSKGTRVIESRNSTIVKSHIRVYKSGLRTIVRTHIRGGKNETRGICITI